jgi:hypothetical protein
MKSLKEAKQHAVDLTGNTTDRLLIWNKMDEMINMDWHDKPALDADPNIKFTTSPQARNTFLGAKRLLTATAPIIKIPRSRNVESLKDHLDDIENMLKAIWELSGKFAGRPVHYDLVDQLLRYDECQLMITNTKDLLELHKNGSKAEKKRYERLARQTPYVFQPVNVRSGWWESDGLGLTAYFRRSKFTYQQAVARFGMKAIEDANLVQNNNQGSIYYCDYWDLDVHFAWLSNHDTKYPDNDQLMVGKENNGKHNLPVIPIVCQVGEASTLESDNKYSRQPLLYGVYKANLWQRLNMLETHMFTNIHNIALSPMYVHTRAPGNIDSEIDLNHKGPVSITSLAPGDKLEPLQREAVNMDMNKGLMEAKQIWDESSIYPQTFGQPLGGQQAFSTVALLSQSGRLPLVAVQQCGGFAIARAFENVLALMKDSGGVRKAIWLNELIEINPKDIDDSLTIDVVLDAELPTDQMKQASIAAQLKEIVSQRYIRENVLRINDPVSMSEEIFEEEFDRTMLQELLRGDMRQQITEEVQQQLLQEMQQQQQMAQMQGPPPMAPQQMAMEQGAPTAGMDSYGGLPPSEAGMIPATRPGEKPVPYGTTPPGTIQEGEM